MKPETQYMPFTLSIDPRDKRNNIKFLNIDPILNVLLCTHQLTCSYAYISRVPIRCLSKLSLPYLYPRLNFYV